ncbi:hypothetical protein [Benzoatithermus flavus]|uniref:Uncharacterized protein n=1 Tax=Benzoatithermus flavus TaxID=3108223 RepID=A0ABU8XRA5_9PROT
MGWKSLGDSELLVQAAGKFDELLTSDGLLAEQNDLKSLGLGVIVPTTNRVREAGRPVPALRAAIARVAPGQKLVISPA